MTRVYLSLGANLGEPLDQLAEALRRLDRQAGVCLAGVSTVYKTAPQGKTDQPDFYNAAAAVETALEPLALLAAIHQVERALGRERKERWGPRLIDIDILLYGEAEVDQEGLAIPHPRMWERAFVLRPLLDLLHQTGGPGHPLARAVQVRLESLPDQGVVPYLDGGSFLRRIQGVE